MTAPALVALAHGSRDPRSAATIKRSSTRSARCAPTCGSRPAFLELSKPSFDDGRRQAGPGRLRRDRRRTAAAERGLPRQGRRPGRRRGRRRAPPGLQVRAPHASSASSRPSSRCSTTGCATRSPTRGCASSTPSVLAAAGSSDPLANQAVARLARVWGARHKLPVTAAFASAAPPATGEAVRAFRAEGRRHVAVASMFLAPGFLPDRAAELALEAGAVAVSRSPGRRPRAGPHDPGPLRRRSRGGFARSDGLRGLLGITALTWEFPALL